MNKELIKRLCFADGASGQEKEVTRIMKEYFATSLDEIMYDHIGSIVGIKKGREDIKVLMTAHVDEIGMIVKEIDDRGFVRVQQVGTLFAHSLGAQEMILTTREGKKIKGIVGTHAKKKEFILNKDVIPIDDIIIDFGVYNKQELLNLGVRIGDQITPNGYFEELNNPDFIAAKAWDDRVGVSLLIELANRIKDSSIPSNLFFAGTVQEEVGLRGARTVGQLVEADVSIAIDVYPCKDTSNDQDSDFKLGEGCCLCILDTTSIAHIGMIDYLERLAKKYGIKYRETMLSRGGTDSGELHKIKNGSVNITLAIPNRYVHTQRSIINKKDYEAALDLLTQFVLTFNTADFKVIRSYKE